MILLGIEVITMTVTRDTFRLLIIINTRTESYVKVNTGKILTQQVIT